MIDISLKLIGKGWLEANLDNGEKSYNITASSLSDGIKDFIIAIALLLEGNIMSQCSWQEEPGQYRWVFETNHSTVNIRILLFEQAFSKQENNKGQEVFLGEDSLLRLGRMVARSIQRLIDFHGEEAYQELWG